VSTKNAARVPAEDGFGSLSAIDRQVYERLLSISKLTVSLPFAMVSL